MNADGSENPVNNTAPETPMQASPEVVPASPGGPKGPTLGRRFLRELRSWCWVRWRYMARA